MSGATDSTHWEPHRPGDSVTGEVVRLPAHGERHGRKLILRGDDGETVLVDASRKHGHTVLANELERQEVRAGDRCRIVYAGWQDSRDGAKTYRLYRVLLLAEETDQPNHGEGQP